MADTIKSIVAVVDDDHRILESLEDLLESAGHTVCVFPSAEALLENDGLSQIDCLISDISMPVMDGFELQRVANLERPELPVILMTGRHEIKSQQSPTHQSFFRKPFDGQELLAAVTAALRSFQR